MADLIFLLIVAARVGIPLLIPRLPLPAIVAALVIDAADQTILAAFDAEPANYQGYDKALDVYYLAIAYLSTLRNWPRQVPFRTAQSLWYYRLIGVTAFEYSGVRALLLIFPNTFEYFFIAYEAIRTRWDPARLAPRAVLGLAAGIWVFVKLPQEYWVHVAQLDFTDALANPAFAAAVVVGLVVLAVAGHRLWRRAPTPQWATELRVDATGTTVADTGAEATTARWPLIDHPLVEKTVLTGLVVAVFSQMFDVNATVAQIVIACGFIVVFNSFGTEFLARRGTTWRTTATEFAALLVVNWGGLTLYLLLRSQFQARLQVGPTVLLLGLLTLIIIVYDRFRTIRLTNTYRS